MFTIINLKAWSRGVGGSVHDCGTDEDLLLPNLTILYLNPLDVTLCKSILKDPSLYTISKWLAILLHLLINFWD